MYVIKQNSRVTNTALKSTLSSTVTCMGQLRPLWGTLQQRRAGCGLAKSLLGTTVDEALYSRQHKTHTDLPTAASTIISLLKPAFV